MQAQAHRVKTTGIRRPAWKRQAPDSARLDALLDAAAAEFNARGVAGARLAHVAQQVGFSRAALYYYVDSREDLAFRCYARACLTTAQDLAVASAGRNGLQRLEQFLRRTLDPARAPAVVLSEVPYLGGERRRAIEQAHAANMRSLQGFIEDGIADRSMRAGDPLILSQAIFGMASWVPLAEAYVEGSGATVRAQAAQSLWDVIENGIAAGPAAQVECALQYEAFLAPPGNLFDRRAAQAHKVDLLLQTASRLFNRHGIDGTSLDDITAALGATKGAFYQYIPQKRALVVRCVERAYDLYEAIADAAQAGGANGLQRSLMGLHLNAQAQASAQPPLSPLTGLEALPAAALRRIRRRSVAIERRFEELARQGIADGSVRTYDVRTIALAGAGAFGWIPKWRDDDGPAPRVIADEMVGLIAHGLKRRKTS
ncbi:MAG TPA: TetR family transcriptional regulator [Solimonas sp.]|nr:TetR family transcriptional regulator [Solimonas sp.]